MEDELVTCLVREQPFARIHTEVNGNMEMETELLLLEIVSIFQSGQQVRNILLNNLQSIKPIVQTYNWLTFTDTCSRQIQVNLKGRVYQEHSKKSGVYNIVLNQPHPYWAKNETAIWFDDENGQWIIGSLEDLNQSIGGFHTTSAPICPHTRNTEWKVYYNFEWTNAYDSVEVIGINEESSTLIPPK